MKNQHDQEPYTTLTFKNLYCIITYTFNEFQTIDKRVVLIGDKKSDGELMYRSHKVKCLSTSQNL